MYIQRDIEAELLSWKNENNRMPLLIRGARQVGKSSVIRHFASNFEHFIEINFELDKEVKAFFEGPLDPRKICEQLSVYYNKPVEPGATLLFFDEIQACPAAILALRFFFEKYGNLHVIAAGSLLEFALAELPSFGVGRIQSIFMYPLSFREFLYAAGELKLLNAIQLASPKNPLALPLHNKALDYFRRFLILGGMPAIVAAYFENNNILQCQKLLDNLIISYNDDFAKYRKRIPAAQIRTVYNAVVNQNGQKFIYSKAVPDLNRQQIKLALDLLIMAGLLFPVVHTSANGIPLGAQVNSKMQKFLVFDSGIFQRILGLQIKELIIPGTSFNSINKGAIAELCTGNELVKYASCYQKQELYYWHREEKGAQAEIDYLIQKGADIIPIEVKASTKGSMQSLHIFMKSRKINRGIRVSQENFAAYDNIEVYPLYAVANILA